MGFFKLIKSTKLSDVDNSTEIPESDYSLLTPDGTFLQFQFIEKENYVVKYDVKPGIWKIVKTAAGFILEPTSFVKDQILEEFVNTKNIEEIVNSFFNNLHLYKDFGVEIPKRNLLLWGPPGCHAKGTKILMADGSLKNVEDVKVGDKLMGPDSTPREVLKLARGNETMVKINPIKGESFIVNINHILHLTPSGDSTLTGTPINIKFSDYLQQRGNFKHKYKLTRTGVDFSEKNLPIPSYILGTWLGDGHSETTRITTIDNEIRIEWEEYAKDIGLNFNMVVDGLTYSITKGNIKGFGKENRNSFLSNLKELEVIQNKHIPFIYKTSSRSQRLNLLAGIIDTDGHLTCGGFDYISKSKTLAEDVVFVARSLGFAVYINECKKSSQNGTQGTYFRVSISGNVSQIPTRLPRKQAGERKQIKSVLRTGFNYEILPEDDYYGFSLDKDHLYLTGDFTIHHNTGKSTSIAKCVSNYSSDGKTAAITWDTNAFDAYEVKHFISRFNYVGVEKIIVIAEDIGGLEMAGVRTKTDSSLLSLLDNTDKTFTIPVMIISTTNHPANLEESIVNRSGRFDDKIEVGAPPAEARRALLKFFSKDKASDEALQLIESKLCDKFPPAHIREAWIRSQLRNRPLVDVIKEISEEIKLYEKAFEKKKMGSIGL